MILLLSALAIQYSMSSAMLVTFLPWNWITLPAVSGSGALTLVIGKSSV